MTELTASELVSAGKQITLANGNTITLRYGFGAIAELEERHGSLSVFSELMQKGEKGPIFSVLGHALWAGSQRKMPLAAFLDLLDPSQTETYANAFGAAFSEAMGSIQGEATAVTETA
jgi:hypothetical protein